VSERPYYFMVAIWGERYRQRFVNLCLPSLLAPGNLPRLRAESGHRFLIATTRVDWAAIEHLPIMAEVRRFATPIFIEVPDQDDKNYTAALRRQTRCLKKLFETAYPAQAYGCLLLPDLILSDGLVETLNRSVAAGHRLVLLPALRQVEEDVLADLSATGLLPHRAGYAETVRPLAVAPRVLADLMVRHLHPEVLVFEEGHACQPLYPPFRFWRVPNRASIILHGFFGLPILMDFAAIPPDHVDCLDHDDYESVYLGRNFSHCNGLHVIQDSDTCGILSLTERATNHSERGLAKRFASVWMPHFALLANLRQGVARHTRRHRDVVRRDLFRRPIRWHADDLDEAYFQEEARIQCLIDRAAGDYFAGGGQFPSRLSLNPRYLILDLAVVPQFLMRVAGLFGILVAAVTGDPRAVARVRKNWAALMAQCRRIIIR
jgi:hypothetical protein